MNEPVRKKGNTGKRYSESERRKILAFVARQGRGGIAAATRAFGVSYIALRRWIQHGPGGAPRGGKAGSAMDGRRARRIRTALATVKSTRAQLAKVETALRRLLK